MNLKPIAGAIVGVALCFSSTVASAATVPASATAFASISPFVALSAFGTMQSRSAVCASAVGASGATAAGQVPTQGCVLPVLDPVAPIVEAPVAVAPVYAPVAVAAPGFGFGIGALLAGLVLAAGLAAVLLSDNNNGRLPISPD